jgi:glycosyltransferase involved in cell wall biosynthesis
MEPRKRERIAVVITTYNNPKSLELCLLSFVHQTYQNFEVHIADDGSGDPTRELIQRLKRELPFEIYHHWHPDQGYRKAKINNTVFRQLDPNRFKVTLCIDHDVIVHPRFVEDHYRAHEKEGFAPLLFMGRRIDLGPKVTEEVTPDTVFEFQRGMNFKLFFSGLRGETRNILRAVRLEGPDWLLKLTKRDRVYDLLGSNYSLTTQTLIDVNGYNEDFKSYWGEDGDLFVRVRNRGIKMFGLIGYAIQWHLYHKRLEETPEHIQVYRALLQNHDYIECQNGIRKLG